MVDDIYTLWRTITLHPDYIAGVLWTADDILHVASEEKANAGELAIRLDLGSWEDVASEDGYNEITRVARELVYESESAA